jgi:hypothetical protein
MSFRDMLGMQHVNPMVVNVNNENDSLPTARQMLVLLSGVDLLSFTVDQVV